MITCSKCLAAWTGVNRCHCTVCHTTFSGLTYFDQHRKNDKCVSPESLGLHDNGKGVWVSDYTWGEE